QFRCLGSNLSSFPIGFAVAASSAFPVAFSTIRLENYLKDPTPCITQTGYEQLDHLEHLRVIPSVEPHENQAYSFERNELVLRERYLDHVNTSYVHLSDGGTSDNLGVQAFRLDLLDTIVRGIVNGHVTGVVLISVNAATSPNNHYGRLLRSPNIFEVLTRVTDLLLIRATTTTQDEVTQELSSMRSFVPVLCLGVSFADIEDETLRSSLNSIPTSFKLTKDEVDTLIGGAKLIVNKKLKTMDTIKELIKSPETFKESEPSTCRIRSEYMPIELVPSSGETSAGPQTN